MQVNLQQEKILNAQKHSKTPLKRRKEISTFSASDKNC